MKSLKEALERNTDEVINEAQEKCRRLFAESPANYRDGLKIQAEIGYVCRQITDAHFQLVQIIDWMDSVLKTTEKG